MKIFGHQQPIFAKFSYEKFMRIFLCQNQFLKFNIFGQGHSGSDEKWMSSLQKTIIFSEKYFLRIFFDPKTGFWKFTFVGKVILHMPIKFEQARMKNEGGVRENVKWTYNDNDNERQRTTDTGCDWCYHHCGIYTAVLKNKNFKILTHLQRTLTA